jgi:uncharacterized membrane protein YhaH (DUF805 family)
MIFNLIACYMNAWKHYFDFAGNTSRKNFWLFMLAHLCVTLLFITLDIWSSTIWQSNPGWLDLGYSLISFIPMLAIITRRLHDIGLSGWWATVFIIPAVGPFWLIYLLSQANHGVNNEEKYAC